MRLDPNVLEKRAYESRRALGLDNQSPVDFFLLKEKLDKVKHVE